MTTGTQTPELLVLIEKKDGTERLSIRSDQLEQIGEKLRGRRRFSIFYSIVLPIMVSAATIAFTTLIQYISWRNSVRLESATNIATKAAESYENAVGSIGKRLYATFLFVPSLRDLIREKQLTKSSNAASMESQTVSPPEFPLAKFHHDLKKHRFESYYEQLQHWNENYDQLLTDVDYALDRPVLLNAGKPSDKINVYASKIEQIDCDRSLTEQLTNLGLNADSLKLRLAGINYCFRQVHAILDDKLTTVLNGAELQWDNSLSDQLTAMLGSIKTMTNEFRCYGLRRIDYYNGQKEGAILNLLSVLKRIMRGRKQEALDHFQKTAIQCSPENRPT